MPAPKGSRNAAKPASKRATGLFQMRCIPTERKAWEGAARAEKKKLTKWVTSTLNEKAKSAQS